MPAGWLPEGAEELFGEGARAEEAYGLLTVDVPTESWIPALLKARDALGCGFFDWLSAVDEPGTGFQVCAHVVSLPSEGPHVGSVRRLLLRTTVPHDEPVLRSATAVFAGAAWHERETHEMFGVVFTEHPGLTPLLLPEAFEGHPLRKDFVLAARVAKAWPGAVEPGESAHGAPRRRQMLPPGVPDPNEWGPLKGQLPPVPSRPARGRAGRAGTGERPARRARSASAGSASQRGEAEQSQTQEQEQEQGQGQGQGQTPEPGSGPRPRPSDAPWQASGPASGGEPGASGGESGGDGGDRGGEPGAGGGDSGGDAAARGDQPGAGGGDSGGGNGDSGDSGEPGASRGEPRGGAADRGSREPGAGGGESGGSGGPPAGGGA
nr:NADH-quinone oxidoreductase subunit C [Streptomyces sp. DSM 40971]